MPKMTAESAARIYVVGERITAYWGTFEWKTFEHRDFSVWQDVLDFLRALGKEIAYVRYLVK